MGEFSGNSLLKMHEVWVTHPRIPSLPYKRYGSFHPHPPQTIKPQHTFLETNSIFAPENWKMNFALGQFRPIFRGQTMLVLRGCNYKVGGNSFSRMQQPSLQTTYPTYYRLKSPRVSKGGYVSKRTPTYPERSIPHESPFTLK